MLEETDTSKKEVFVTAINCMDGRSQWAVLQYMTKEYGVRYVDSPETKPGMDKNFRERNTSFLNQLEDAVVRISVGHHGSRVVAVVGHNHCAGHPVSKEVHITDIKRGVELVTTWDFGIPDSVEVLGLWVDLVEGVWCAERIEQRVVKPTLQTATA